MKFTIVVLCLAVLVLGWGVIDLQTSVDKLRDDRIHQQEQMGKLAVSISDLSKASETNSDSITTLAGAISRIAGVK